MNAWGGLRAAVSWLTVLPVRGPVDVDRALGRRVIAATPLVGLLLGSLAAALLWALVSAGLTPPLAGLLVVGALALATRGMHVDGLADTADGLGCYGPPARALEVMRSGGAGPFGVAALVVVLGVQAMAFGQLADQRAWWAVAAAITTGRVAVVLTCRNPLGAATDTGFGALVAGTQGRIALVGWTVAAAAAAIPTVDGRPWQGPLVVLTVLAAVAAVCTHCARRFGGITGDVLGASIETTTALTAVGLILGN